MNGAQFEHIKKLASEHRALCDLFEVQRALHSIIVAGNFKKADSVLTLFDEPKQAFHGFNKNCVFFGMVSCPLREQHYAITLVRKLPEAHGLINQKVFQAFETVSRK